MRILFVTDHAGASGGAEKSLITLVRSLQSRGHDIFCVLPEKGETYTALASYGVKLLVCAMPAIERTRNPLRIAGWLCAMLWFGLVVGIYVRIKRIDVIHSNKTPCTFYAAAASFFSWRPIIWHVRNVNKNFGIIGKLLFAYVDVVVCISHAIAKPFFDTFPDSEKIVVVYNGVMINPLKKISLRSENLMGEMGIKKPAFLVGVVGRITAWKKIEVFLQAMKRIVDDGQASAVYGVIIGDCVTSKEKQMHDDISYKSYVQSVHANLNLGERVRFIGFKKDVETYIAELDMLVLPSENEPFGRILIEAMALGVPVIASRSGAVPEIILDNETGVLFPVGDDRALADAILRLYHDPLLLRRIAKDGWKRVYDFFSADVYGQNVENIYRSLV